jgi:hypothetical protein
MFMHPISANNVNWIFPFH